MLPKPGKRVPGPCYDLKTMQAEVRAGNVHVYRTRAVDLIRKARNCSRERAVRFARDAVLSLTAENYAHTIMFPNGQMHDVYGLLLREEGWYVKIEIHVDDGQPGIVSCHPAEYDLKTLGGVVPGTRE
jgi:hypothetical protein